MKTYLRKIMAFINDEEGASAIEYALLVGMVALAIVAGRLLLAPTIPEFSRPWTQRCGSTINYPGFAGAGAGASGLRPLPYEGNQSCRGT